MAKYKVEIKRSAKKEIQNLPKNEIQRILLAIQKLSEEPRMPGTIKLKGNEEFYRFRIGKYRIVYEIQDRILVVTIIRIAHRKDVYR